MLRDPHNMRILTVNMPSDPTKNLGSIQMDRLGATVVIAGKNGAGKSRLLKKILDWPNRYSPFTSIRNMISLAERTTIANSSREDLARSQNHLANQRLALAHREQLVLTADEKPTIIPFVPRSTTPQDPNSCTKSQLLSAVGGLAAPGVSGFNGSFAIIQVLQDRYREAKSSENTLSEEQITTAVNEYRRIESLIEQFLGTKITRSIDGEAQLFGLPLGKSSLSDGQTIIVHLCAALHAQAAKLDEVILLMDEPENHLHPAALLDLVEMIQTHIGNGQLWIATHSIPLLAQVDPSSIWWMEDNTIRKAGDKPEKVLEGLLGGEERRGKLATFLDLPFALASNRFAAECLIPPPTVEHRDGDPQTRQILTVLEKLRTAENVLRVLDFGAGRGRLASELAESWLPDQRAGLDYIAFDPSEKDAEECRAAIGRLHENPNERLFHDYTKLRERYDEGSFHVVVMCNVLHEILPADWSDLFGSSGKLTRLLRSDGYLLLVEVQQLPYGERAHEHGFLVLDTAQLRKLFNVGEPDGASFTCDAQRDGWLKAHLISQALLRRYSSDFRKEALLDLCSTARDRIRGLRAQGTDYRQGRLHGFWVQQFANAQLALD
jgi:ABC-type cobalamin/Fe3+-siderophores transport system ATPase subunit/SAM-dependent methyltransferase